MKNCGREIFDSGGRIWSQGCGNQMRVLPTYRVITAVIQVIYGRIAWIWTSMEILTDISEPQVLPNEQIYQ